MDQNVFLQAVIIIDSISFLNFQGCILVCQIDFAFVAVFYPRQTAQLWISSMRCIFMDCSQWNTSGLQIVFDTFKFMPTIHKLFMVPKKATGFSVRSNIGPFNIYI